MTLHLWYFLGTEAIDNSTRLMVADGWLTLFFCKILPRSDLLDAGFRHPSSVVINRRTGESSRCKRVSTSTSQPDSRANPTRLNRSLSALMATVLSLSSETGME